MSSGPVCLLAGTSVSSREAHLPWLLQSFAELSATFSWAHGLLNLFDDLPQWTPELEALRHARTVVTRVPGFKVLFWKREIRRSRYRRYSHIWLVDSDMAIAPSRFNLRLLLHMMDRMNASIVQPSPYGGGAGLYSYTSIRGANRQTGVCGDRGDTRSTSMPLGVGPMVFDEKCVACRVPVVEVKVPLFTSAAWDVVHSLVLTQLPDASLLSDQGLDLIWCSLVEKHVGSGCTMKLASDEWHKALQESQKKGTRPPCNGRPDTPSCSIPGCGSTCAVVYATPIEHRDHRSILTVLAAMKNLSSSLPAAGRGGRGAGSHSGGNGIFNSSSSSSSSSSSNPLGGGTFVSNAIMQKLMALHGIHKQFPTWRPPNTLLRAQPCVSSRDAPIRDVLQLSNWSLAEARSMRLRLASEQTERERLERQARNETPAAAAPKPRSQQMKLSTPHAPPWQLPWLRTLPTTIKRQPKPPQQQPPRHMAANRTAQHQSRRPTQASPVGTSTTSGSAVRPAPTSNAVLSALTLRQGRDAKHG